MRVYPVGRAWRKAKVTQSQVHPARFGIPRTICIPPGDMLEPAHRRRPSGARCTDEKKKKVQCSVKAGIKMDERRLVRTTLIHCNGLIRRGAYRCRMTCASIVFPVERITRDTLPSSQAETALKESGVRIDHVLANCRR